MRSARSKRTSRAPSSLNRALKCNFSDLVVRDSYLRNKRVGDTQTAEVAREIRAEEEAMAERLASKWDSFLDMTLRNE